MNRSVIVGLKTLDIRAKLPTLDTPERAIKKRVFTENEWSYLNSRSTAELHHRVRMGDHLIELLYRPEMLNMTQTQAHVISSNLRYQQDAIREIIKAREVHNEKS